MTTTKWPATSDSTTLTNPSKLQTSHRRCLRRSFHDDYKEPRCARAISAGKKPFEWKALPRIRKRPLAHDYLRRQAISFSCSLFTAPLIWRLPLHLQHSVGHVSDAPSPQLLNHNRPLCRPSTPKPVYGMWPALFMKLGACHKSRDSDL